MPDFLNVQHLKSLAGAQTIDSYFDDDQNGSLAENSTELDMILDTAEGLFYSTVMKFYKGDPRMVGSAARTLLENDKLALTMIAWVGVELASERRREFVDANGKGPWMTQYDRAMTYLEGLAKGANRSPAEAQAGANLQVGGNVAAYTDSSGSFIFAPSRNNPQGGGGF